MWVSLVFTGWVLIVSIYILVLNLRSKDADAAPAAGTAGDRSTVTG
jgi:hypothetical protein